MRKKIVALTFVSGLLIAVAVPIFGVAGTASAVPSSEKKVTICHMTGSETNPWVVITISTNAWRDLGEPGHNSPHDGPGGVDHVVNPGTPASECGGGGEP